MPRDNRGPKRVKWLLSKWKVDPTLTDKEDREITEQIAEEKKGKCRQILGVLSFKLKKFLYSYDPCASLGGLSW